MASLREMIKKVLFIVKKPSSTFVMKQLDYARNSCHFSAKRPSLLSWLQKRTQAGMTVEASFVLPLCLFFLMNLGSAIEMIRLHNNIQYAIWNTGSRMASLACEEDYPIPELLTEFYIRSRITDCLGREYLDSSPLAKGSRGLWLLESDMADESDELDIVVTYQVKSFLPLAGFRPFRMANRCCIRLWNGYEIPVESGQEEKVYVTVNGEVFHRDRNCTHLQLSVRETAYARLEEERNEWGQRYRACEKCAAGEAPIVVYVTEEGDRYHYRRNCPGLKRTVIALAPDEAEDYRPCSRCGG